MKKWMVTAAIGTLVLFGIIFFAITKNSQKSTTEQATSKNKMNTSMKNGNKFSGTFLDLLTIGKDFVCTFDSVDENGNQISGKAYVSSGGEKLNSQFTLTNTDGSKMTSNAISDGEYSYVWTSDQTQGYKMKTEPGNESLFGQSESSTESESTLTDNDEVDFDCSPWSPDMSMFVPPTNIEFVDTSELMMQMEKQSETMMEENSIDCSVCDQLPAGESQNQCLQSLGC